MGVIGPAAIWGFVAPIILFVFALWIVRRWKSSITPDRDDYTGAMASPAFEAMMNEARRQREALKGPSSLDSSEDSTGDAGPRNRIRDV